MNLELIREWVDALRSGKYEQGRLALRSKDDKYCCLGVLCDIAKSKVGLDWNFHNDKYYIGEDGAVDTSSIILPVSIVNFLGIGAGHLGITIDVERLLPHLRVGIPSNIKVVYLIELNDYYKFPFTQIADILEQQYLM